MPTSVILDVPMLFMWERLTPESDTTPVLDLGDRLLQMPEIVRALVVESIYKSLEHQDVMLANDFVLSFVHYEFTTTKNKLYADRLWLVISANVSSWLKVIKRTVTTEDDYRLAFKDLYWDYAKDRGASTGDWSYYDKICAHLLSKNRNLLNYCFGCK